MNVSPRDRFAITGTDALSTQEQYDLDVIFAIMGSYMYGIALGYVDA